MNWVVNEYGVERFVSGEFKENGYLVEHLSTGKAWLIDPGAELERYLERIDERRLCPQAILLTHAHFDHLETVKALTERLAVSCWVQAEDLRLLKHASTYSIRYLKRRVVPPNNVTLYSEEGLQELGCPVRVIPCPGHTQGSVFLQFREMIFTGDTLFKGLVGPSDPPNGDPQALRASLEHFMGLDLPSETMLFPGHGKPWTFGDAQLWWGAIRSNLPQATIFERSVVWE